MEIKQGTIRAKDGGDLVWVCAECGAEIPGNAQEVVVDHAPGGNPIPSYGMELDPKTYADHWEKEHGDG